MPVLQISTYNKLVSASTSCCPCWTLSPFSFDFHFYFLPPILLKLFASGGHLSQNGEKEGCPFTKGTCWTLLVKRQRVFLEPTKLLSLLDTLTIYLIFILAESCLGLF
jgi:hypothetical protein